MVKCTFTFTFYQRTTERLPSDTDNHTSRTEWIITLGKLPSESKLNSSVAIFSFWSFGNLLHHYSDHIVKIPPIHSSGWWITHYVQIIFSLGEFHNTNFCFTISNIIEVFKESVPWTKKILHLAVEFEAGEESRIAYESLYWFRLNIGLISKDLKTIMIFSAQ